MEWDQLPKPLDDTERNDTNAALVVCLTAKALASTFLRAELHTPARWEELDFKKGLGAIRINLMKAGKSHQAPLIEPLKEFLKKPRRLRDTDEHAFYSPRGRVFVQINKDFLNTHWKGEHRTLTTTHGFRHIVLTAKQKE